VKKSHAIIDCAFARRNSRQQSPARSPAGDAPARCRIFRTFCRRDRHADAGQLTNDSLVAPAWILTGNPQDELADVLRDRGPAGTSRGVVPPSANKQAVPTQQRVRADEERPPARTAQNPAGRSQKDTIGILQTRPGDLSAKKC
jgi:hypothetical protein